MSAPSALTRFLQRTSSGVFVAYASTVAFATYFCMYAFRKPFAAAAFEGDMFLGSDVALKSALIISQLIGYTASKFLGIKVCSEATPGARARALVGLILASEAALLLYGVLPGDFKVLAIFLNGLPLGMVWGLVVSYLEGRRSSELLLAGLACSFIVSSGVVKDVGVSLLGSGVSESWMPAAVGGIFLPLFLLSVWLLNQLPAPNAEDIAERTERRPMNGADRVAFVREFMTGLVCLLATYLVLTAYRDFRDNFSVEILQQLGFTDIRGLMSASEMWVTLGVIVVMAALNFVRDNRWGLLSAMGVMTVGVALVGGSTLAFDLGQLDGFWWMVCTGLGSYLAYVPFNTLLFDRMIAATRSAGTAVFAIYLADAIGYTGSIGSLLVKDLLLADASRLDFLRMLSYGLAGVGTLLLLGSAVYFAARTRSDATVAPAAVPTGSLA
jgi:hypothetical protein